MKLTQIFDNVALSVYPGVITYNFYKFLEKHESPKTGTEKMKLAGYSLLYGGFIDGISTIPYFSVDKAIKLDGISLAFIGAAIVYRAATNVFLSYNNIQ